MLRKTKIVCTLGPSTDDPAILKRMILAGMNVARLNFSHGNHEEHKKRADMVKKLRQELDVPLAIMIDTKGPDVRVGRFTKNFVELHSGETFTLHTEPVTGTKSQVSVTYADLCRHLEPGHIIMLDDGLIKLAVEKVYTNTAVCRVVDGGILANNKSLNVPGVKLDIPYMRENDLADINFAIDNDFDYIAASFVRNVEDLEEIKRVLRTRNVHDTKIIAKIENSEGIENIEAIMQNCDCIMIARGDMGVELEFEKLPAIQKKLINQALRAGKITITATQMLESMIKSPRPTRAETPDVANAIYDGTSAIMLSGETSVGEYPVEVVETMAKIAQFTECEINYENRFNNLPFGKTNQGTTDAISHAVCAASFDLAAQIITMTTSGKTACMISRYRPKNGLIAFTPHQKTYHQLALSWGCQPLMLPEMDNTDALYNAALELAKAQGLVLPGNKIIFTAGVPLGQKSGTNLMRIGSIE